MKEIVSTLIPASSPLFGIAELAHRLDEQRGRKQGHHLEDWIEAERRIFHGHAGSDCSTATGREQRDDRQLHQDNENERRYDMTTQTLGFLLATALGFALIPGFIAKFFTAKQLVTAGVQPSGTSFAKPTPVSRLRFS